MVYGRNKRVYKETILLCILILLSMTAEPAEMRMAHLGLIVLSDVFWSVFPSSLQSSAKQGYLSFRKKFHATPDRSWNRKWYEMKLFCPAQLRNSGRMCFIFLLFVMNCWQIINSNLQKHILNYILIFKNKANQYLDFVF